VTCDRLQAQAPYPYAVPVQYAYPVQPGQALPGQVLYAPGTQVSSDDYYGPEQMQSAMNNGKVLPGFRITCSCFTLMHLLFCFIVMALSRKCQSFPYSSISQASLFIMGAVSIAHTCWSHCLRSQHATATTCVPPLAICCSSVRYAHLAIKHIALHPATQVPYSGPARLAGYQVPVSRAPAYANPTTAAPQARKSRNYQV
jgi:hypothetical protein